MRVLLALALLATAASGTAAAQSAPADTVTLRPGDPALVTDWLTPHTRAYTVRLVQPMAMDVGTGTETYTAVDGEIRRVSTVAVPMQQIQQTDSIAVVAGTFAPLRHRSTGGPVDVSLEFMDEGIAGLMTPRDGEPETVLVTTDAPVWDGAWTTEIAQSLPFADGYVAKIPVYQVGPDSQVADVVMTVTGQATATTADGDRPAWTVEAQMGPMTMAYVIDAETRAILVTRFSPQEGVVVEISSAD